MSPDVRKDKDRHAPKLYENELGMDIAYATEPDVSGGLGIGGGVGGGGATSACSSGPGGEYSLRPNLVRNTPPIPENTAGIE